MGWVQYNTRKAQGSAVGVLLGIGAVSAGVLVMRIAFPRTAWIYFRQATCHVLQWAVGAICSTSARVGQRMQSTSRSGFAYLHAIRWWIISGGALALLIITGVFVWKVPLWRVGVGLHWDWLIIPVLTVAGTILLRFSARIERPVLAYFAACLLLAGAGWTGYNQYGTHRTNTEIQTLAYNKVSVGTINFVDLIANMVKEASNEWLPSNEA